MDGYQDLLLSIFRPSSRKVKRMKAQKQARSEKQFARQVAAEKRAEAQSLRSVERLATQSRRLARKIAERTHGRLPKEAVVHHINGDPMDNHQGNLLVCTRGYHSQLHFEMSRRYAQEHF